VARELRKLRNEELHNLYSQPHVIKVMKLRAVRWAGHVARTAEVRSAYKILVRKLEVTTWKS